MNGARLELLEYGSGQVQLGAEAARELADIGAGRIEVGLGEAPGAYTVTATSYVGTVVTPDLELLIRPKVPMRNLFMLLDIGLPASAWRDESFAYGEDRGLLAAVAAFFARTLERTIAAGLLRSYRGESSRLLALRGRIDFPELIRMPGLVAPLACRFDEYTADIEENRILRAAVAHLMRVPGIRAGTRRALMLSLSRFEEVADVPVDPDSVLRLRFTRLNRHYEPVLRLARLILKGTTLIDRSGGARASAFLVNMNALFQDWLTNRLTRALRAQLQVVAEPTVHLGRERKVAMQPDFVFRSGGHDVYVGDVKYKIASAGFGHSSDFYQLFAYATALRLPEGALIYCQTDGEEPHRAVVVRHVDMRLWTYRIDLGGLPADVERQVSILADWIVERFRAEAHRHALRPVKGP